MSGSRKYITLGTPQNPADIRDYVKTEHSFTYKEMSITGQVVNAPALLAGIIAGNDVTGAGTNALSVTVYDGSDSDGTVILGPVTVANNTVYEFPGGSVEATVGIFHDVGDGSATGANIHYYYRTT